MAEGRDRAAWAHTSLVLAFLGNGLLKAADGRPFTPHRLNPYTAGQAEAKVPVTPEESRENFKALRKVYLKRGAKVRQVKASEVRLERK